jgi:hypothetical protein
VFAKANAVYNPIVYGIRWVKNLAGYSHVQEEHLSYN